jgi:hypothetical protein
MFSIFKIEKGVEARIGFKEDVSPFATIAAVGSTAGDIFFTAEGDTLASAVAGLHKYSSFVNEFQFG